MLYIKLTCKPKYKKLLYCQYRKRSLAFERMPFVREKHERERKTFLSVERFMLETLDFAFYIGSTLTDFSYFDLYLSTAYAAHYVYFTKLTCSLVI